MRNNSIRFILSHRLLLYRTTLAEMRGRYAGAVLGMAWVAIAPGLLLALYAVIYLKVFPTTLDGLNSTAEFTLFIFSGLVPFLMTSESLALGVGSVVANKAVLENTVFPIDLAPVKSVLSGQATMLLGVPVILIGTFAVGRASATSALVFVVWVFQVMALIGLTWILALLNVVFRDIANVIGVVLMALLICSPFAFTIENAPETVRPVILLNPLAYYIRAYQDVLVWGRIPSAGVSAFVVLFSTMLFVGGGWFFFRAKRVIIDYV